MLEIEQILKLSGNRNTVQQAQKIAKDIFWKNPSSRDVFLWANFKGKSIQSYEVFVRISSSILFKCNCSSKQNPCKHALGLLLYYHENESAFKAKSELPKNLISWEEERSQMKDESLLEQEKKINEEKALISKNKNREKRIQQMQSGAFRIQDWLLDIIKHGLVNLESQEQDFWDGILSRLVDHKLAGLTAHIFEIKNSIEEDDNWVEFVTQKIAWLNKVLLGIQNIDQWNNEWQNELLRIGGVSQKSAELDIEKGVDDEWVILNIEEGITDNGGNFRKSWMYGKKSNRFGFLLEFNFLGDKFPALPKLGYWFKGNVVFFPGPTPLRLKLIRWGSPAKAIFQLPGLSSFADLNQYYLANLKINPWLLDLPVILNEIVPVVGDVFHLQDQNGSSLDIFKRSEDWWKLMALSAGEPITIFGIWNGHQLLPQGCCKKGIYIPLELNRKSQAS